MIGFEIEIFERMKKKIFIAGHKGMVGSAIIENLKKTVIKILLQ